MACVELYGHDAPSITIRVFPKGFFSLYEPFTVTTAELLAIKRELTVIKVQIDGLLDSVDKMDRQRKEGSGRDLVGGGFVMLWMFVHANFCRYLFFTDTVSAVGGATVLKAVMKGGVTCSVMSLPA